MAHRKCPTRGETLDAKAAAGLAASAGCVKFADAESGRAGSIAWMKSYSFLRHGTSPEDSYRNSALCQHGGEQKGGGMIGESVICVNSNMTNDFFSKSQHLNFVSRLSIWLTMGLLGGPGRR
jgi:hypothetical protein